MKKYISTGFLFFFFAVCAQAQTNTMDSNTVKATAILTEIQLASGAYDNQQFDIVSISSDGAISDTLAGTCKIQGDNYHTVFDSVEQIQNNYLNLEVHYDGKIMVASRPAPFTKQFFKGNVDEPLFQGMNVDSISIATVGANKQLLFSFLPESDYTEYKITYDPSSYRVSEIFIKIKVPDGAGGFVPGSFMTSKILLQNFVTLTTPQTFDTSVFLSIDAGGQLIKQPAYNAWEIVNLRQEN